MRKPKQIENPTIITVITRLMHFSYDKLHISKWLGVGGGGYRLHGTLPQSPAPESSTSALSSTCELCARRGGGDIFSALGNRPRAWLVNRSSHGHMFLTVSRMVFTATGPRA